jgi:hypothetical protein
MLSQQLNFSTGQNSMLLEEEVKSVFITYQSLCPIHSQIKLDMQRSRKIWFIIERQGTSMEATI